MSKTIDVLVAEITIAERRLLKRVKPLRKRLKSFNLFVSWNADRKEWFIHQPNSKDAIKFWLDESKLKELMDMSNTELIKYCDDWGKA